MAKSMPKTGINYNTKRRLSGLGNRITKKALAHELGISTSTLRRYEKGEVKHPKIDLDSKVTHLWNRFGTLQNTDNVNLKKKRVFKKLGYEFTEKVHYEKHNTTQYRYKVDYIPPDNIEEELGDLISQIEHARQHEYYFVKLVGIDENGEEKRFSTPIAHISNLDRLYENLKALLAKPSKTLKSAIHFEIIGRDMN